MSGAFKNFNSSEIPLNWEIPHLISAESSRCKSNFIDLLTDKEFNLSQELRDKIILRIRELK